MIRRCGGNFQASLFHRTQLVTVQLRLGFRARHRHYRSTFAYVAIAVENNGVAEKDFKTYFYITKKGMDLHLSNDAWYPSETRLASRSGLGLAERWIPSGRRLPQ
jgi:hypothetical protein